MGLFFGPLGIFLFFLEHKKYVQRPYDHFGGCIKPYRAIWTHFRPNFMISRFPDFQTPTTVAEEFSDPNLTPLPTHPGIKYVARALAVT